jgi:hypothetical protein
MKQSFQDQWKQRLWEFERESIFAMKDIPETLSEENIIAYIKEHRRLHQLGSNPIVWLILLWLPLLSLTTGLVYLWWLLVSLITPFVYTYAIVFGLLFINTIFAITYVLDKGSFYVAQQGLFSIGWVIGCFFHLPFLPLLKVRQLQLHYSIRYRKSFCVVFWREPPTRLGNAKTMLYIHQVDRNIQHWHKRFIPESLKSFRFPGVYQWPIVLPNQTSSYQKNQQQRLPQENSSYSSIVDYLHPRIDLFGYLSPRIFLVLVSLWVLVKGIIIIFS